MHFTSLEIPDVILVRPDVQHDERGYFFEGFRKDHFAENGIHVDFVQENYSTSKQGVLRGLHYQIQKPQGKLLRVVTGKIFDAVVDLRRHAPTFGQAVVCTLSAEENCQLWIPPGFAHGFYVVSQWAELAYKATNYYAPKWERTLLWKDSDLSINWPLKAGQPPVLSKKDSLGKRLMEAETYY